ncbi:MAG: hypothetical protein H6Q72_1094 [Firmicutes bacterium]|nr:hypothetical protein [Bacillota bacterium]
MGGGEESRCDARILFTCSGCCAEGELSDKIGRQLRKKGYARCGSSCLAGICAGYPKFINVAKEVSEVVAIDGCGMACAARTLEKAGIAPRSYVLTAMGLNECCDQQEFVGNVCQHIMGNIEIINVRITKGEEG